MSVHQGLRLEGKEVHAVAVQHVALQRVVAVQEAALGGTGRLRRHDNAPPPFQA